MPPARQRSVKRAPEQPADEVIEQATRKRTRSAAPVDEPKPAAKSAKTTKAKTTAVAASKAPASRAKALPKEPEPEEIVQQPPKPAPKAPARKTTKAAEKASTKSSAKETVKEPQKEELPPKPSKRTTKKQAVEQTKDTSPDEEPDLPQVKATSKPPAKSTSKSSTKATAKAPAKAAKETKEEPEEHTEDEAPKEKGKAAKAKAASKEKPKAQPKEKAPRAPAKRKVIEDNEDVSQPAPSKRVAKVAEVVEAEPTTRFSRRLAARKGIDVAEEPKTVVAPVKSRTKKVTKVADATNKASAEPVEPAAVEPSPPAPLVEEEVKQVVQVKKAKDVPKKTKESRKVDRVIEAEETEKSASVEPTPQEPLPVDDAEPAKAEPTAPEKVSSRSVRAASKKAVDNGEEVKAAPAPKTTTKRPRGKKAAAVADAAEKPAPVESVVPAPPSPPRVEEEKEKELNEVNEVKDTNEVKEVNEVHQVKQIQQDDQVKQIEQTESLEEAKPIEEVKPVEEDKQLEQVDAGDEVKKVDKVGVKELEEVEEVKETKDLKESAPVEALIIPRISLPQVRGDLFTCGSGEQIGFRNDQAEKKRPSLVPQLSTEFCSVASGSMHSIAISPNGSVFTFGCNDECALGRPTEQPENNSTVDPNETELLVEETLAAIPDKVDLPNVVKVTAGDSHTAALTEDGDLMICGCFRSNNGKVGLFIDTIPKPEPRFRKVEFDASSIVDISSGCNHVLFLTQDGSVYSFGDGEHGQLGRFDKDTCEIKKDLSNVESFLTPQKVHLPQDVKCDRIWTSNNASFARTTTGELYAWGLNNFSQLGLSLREAILTEHKPLKVPSFSESPIVFICGGLLHTLALTQDGRVYSCGQSKYGSLGLGEGKVDQETFTCINSLNDEVVTAIACGEDSSFAVAQSGKLFSWGMASPHLGHDTAADDGGDHFVPKQVISKKLASAQFYAVAAGSMHMISIASLKETNGN